MADAYCSDCKRNTEVVLDHAAGDTICLECGLVLESYSIDETAEWRSFADDSGDGADPDRVGGPVDPLLNELVTVIAPTKGGKGDLPSTRLPDRVTSNNRSLILAFKTIDNMCHRLGIVASIKQRANEICKKLEDQNSSKGKNLDSLLAACLFIACRQENLPRTVKDFCTIAGVTKKDIGRAIKFIQRNQGDEEGQLLEMGTVRADNYMRRFCSNLGLKNQKVKAAQEAVRKLEAFDIRRSPFSIAAAVIYVITLLSDDKKTLKDVALATGVADTTIRNSYKDIYSHLVKIIPNWYAREEDVKNLRSP